MGALGMVVIGASLRSSVLFEYLKRHPAAGFVTGIYDVVPERSQFLIRHYGLKDCVIYDTLQQAVDDKRAGGAFISSPDSEHVVGAVAALKAGKHVFCEKPMTTTLKDCDTIIAAARKASGVFYLGMNLRHGPVHETIHDIVASGQLGKITTIEANEYYYGGRTYFRRWNGLRKWSGGLWLTKAVHDFDLLNWISGGKPRRVFATCSLSHYKPIPKAGTHCRVCKLKLSCPDYFDVEAHKSNPWYEFDMAIEKFTGRPIDVCLYNGQKDTFDNGIALVEFDNDVRATYTVNVVSGACTRQMRINGSLASLESDMEQGLITIIRRHTNHKIIHDVRERMKSSHGGADDAIMADFFRCCQTGDKPRSSWSDGRLSVEVGLAATKSSDTGKPVNITSD